MPGSHCSLALMLCILIATTLWKPITGLPRIITADSGLACILGFAVSHATSSLARAPMGLQVRMLAAFIMLWKLSTGLSGLATEC
jgi:hypothetical protein